MPAPLHSQGVAITFGGVALGLLAQEFDVDAKAATRTINAIDGAVENGLYVPLVETTTLERTATLQGLCTALPSPELLATPRTLQFTGSGWAETVGLCVLDSWKYAGKAGEYMRVNFSFRRAS